MASPMKMKHSKRQKLDLDVSKCIFCQSTRVESLRTASEQGKITFLKALQVRCEAGQNEQYEGILQYLDQEEDGNYTFKADQRDILWHKGCYSSFTSNMHLPSSSHPSGLPSSSQRPQRDVFDFKNFCIFCNQKSFKKDKNLIRVATFEFCQTLEKKANDLNDIELKTRVGDFSKLIACDARYHKACHSKYLLQKAEPSNESGQSPHDLAFDEFMASVGREIHDGVAYDMNDLISKYRSILIKYMPEEEANSYTKHKLKSKILSQCENIHIVSSGSKKPDIVLSKNIQIKHVVNTASQLKKIMRELEIEKEFETDCTNMEFSVQQILFYAALIIRNTIVHKTGIEHLPLNPGDISEREAENIIDKDLYNFLYWLISQKPPRSPESVDTDKVKHFHSTAHRHILSLGQDIVFVSSGGKCKTPKHVGLGVTFHQMTQSKEAISLLNKYGHCISYDEVQRIDTTWSNMQLDNDVCTPPNMLPGEVTTGAGDNFNRATESVTGIHHDVVNMVLYQKAQDDPWAGHFGDFTRDVLKKRSRSLQDMDYMGPTILLCPNLADRQPGPRQLLGKVKTEWFTTCSQEHQSMRVLDQTLLLMRMIPLTIFQAEFEHVVNNTMPGWTVFHAIVSPKTNIKATAIGYCRMIPAPATDMNTVYTMMKSFQSMFRRLGQDWTYVTYDEALYSKAQQIKWRNPEEFSNDFMEMGGMHRAMNFMGSIGSVMEESGFEDIVIEANIYGPSVVSHIMKGKAYNRGVRLHKLMNEALTRLKWIAHEEWYKENETPISGQQRKVIAEKATTCLELFENLEHAQHRNKEETRTAVYDCIDSNEPLRQSINRFTAIGRQVSDTFLFWDNYVNDFSQLLLDFIAAKRDSMKSIELESFAEMLPLDFMCGHLNYAKWGTVYIAESRLMEVEKPELYEIISKSSTVHRSPRCFSGVWQDMAIEQSLNRDCGKYQYLCTKEKSLAKYYLTAHYKAVVAAKTKDMSGLSTSNSDLHKEASSKRIADDERTIKEIVKVVEEQMTNPFRLEQGSSTTNKQPLINIATSRVVPQNVTDSLCDIRQRGLGELEKFVGERLQTGSTDFTMPMSKPPFKKFSSLNKPLVTKKQQVTKTINIDREIFGRLAVVAQARDVDLRKLLSHELAPVPLPLFNLDGTMRKTQKSAAIEWLEKGFALQDIPVSRSPTLAVVDFMMVLRMVCTDTAKCHTFGSLSDLLLNLILALDCQHIAVVCDNYFVKSSIKDSERARRGSIQMQEIRNPTSSTPLPKQRQKMLSNPKNKIAVANFLMQDWLQKAHHKLLPGSTFCLAGGFPDPTRAVLVTHNHQEEVPELASDHEEADSRMFLHVSYARKQGITRVVMWSMDTDVIMMSARYCVLLDVDEFFVKTGTGRKKRYLPIHVISRDIGRNVSVALPCLHAFTGCDSTSSFSGLGKRKWMKTVLAHQELLSGLSRLGESPGDVHQEAKSACLSLVLFAYGGRPDMSLDELRYELFTKKNLTSERLPPTSDSFAQHLRRANYQTYIWTHAEKPFLNLPLPDENGWYSDEQGRLFPQMMTLAAAPDAVLEFTQCKCQSGCATRRCRCNKESMLCTDACACDRETCSNRLLAITDSDSDED